MAMNIDAFQELQNSKYVLWALSVVGKNLLADCVLKNSNYIFTDIMSIVYLHINSPCM